STGGSPRKVAPRAEGACFAPVAQPKESRSLAALGTTTGSGRQPPSGLQDRKTRTHRMTTPCPACRCSADSPAHAIAVALAIDDLDRAMALGLLQAAACPHCSAACRGRVAQARDARLAALAARDRYRARQARLARREAE